MCEIRFYDVRGQSTNDVKEKILKHGQMSIFGTFFNLIRWIQLCHKKESDSLDCCDNILLDSS